MLDGQASNEAQFKYLMNNAIASKDELNLSVGVTLTSEQVAALTHDIVWLESQEVNGEQVLVPVVYLAQASGRLAPNGALIAGNDVSLIAGKDLTNVGTLKASNNLSAKAAGDLTNSGLIQAGGSLDLLAGNTIVNKAGGIIAGRDVSATAINGDVINERTLTTHQSSAGTKTEQRGFADSAARIEAANDLAISAGRDISNTGGVLQSGRDLALRAGRDVNVDATQVNNSLYLDSNRNSSDITQLGARATAGRDLSIQAGRDVSLVASQLEAKRDVAVAAGENLLVSAAADESHLYAKTKKVTAQEDHVSQVASGITAGGSVIATAANNVAVVGSQLKAADEAYVYAGNNLELLAAQNKDYSYYEKTKKKSGAFSSSSKTTLTETDNALAVGASITAGNAVTLAAVNDLKASGASVSSTSGALKASAGRDITIEAAQSTYASLNGSSTSKRGVLSGSSKLKNDASQQSVAESSTFSGNTTSLSAGRDATIQGSNVVSTEQTTVVAGRNVLVDTSAEAERSQHLQSVKRSGLMGTGGIGVTVGSSLNKATQDATAQSQKASTLGSVEGNVSVIAAHDVVVRGADVIAGKDISFTGQNVSVLAAASQVDQRQTTESRKSGLTLALSGVVGSALNTAVQNTNEARKADTGDSRLNALQGIKAGLSSYQAWQAAQVADASSPTGDAGAYWGISLSLGAQHAQSVLAQTQTTQQGTSLTAGRDITINATGDAGLGGDIFVQGAKAKAGRDVVLNANRDILLNASADTRNRLWKQHQRRRQCRDFIGWRHQRRRAEYLRQRQRGQR
ncbi:hemagglutinin repeat-containing protein [Pseudomonas sp. KNUC1026]|uniref:hemagglutinin repeat-containing protein n=1 Tax=Pseudomonas sp. KNUC1026 TaxID=2893890 RepID=UPI0022A6F25E|nr:hemagglutinin repeat-containing protein [Pseudomonas sp. KNUC1026]